MNYYEHNLGDWAKKCAHLTFAEEGCYRRLLDWYYANERPLPPRLLDVYKCARCRTRSDHAMVKKILGQFFELAPDGWHQSRCDTVIASYVKFLPVSLHKKLQQNVRQQNARDRRATMIKKLADIDIIVPWKTKTSVLLELCREHGLTPPPVLPSPFPKTDPPLPPPVTRDSSVTPDEKMSDLNPNPINTSVTQSAAALSITASTESARAFLAGAHIAAIRKAGFASVNGFDPRLADLIEMGVTPEECGLVAAEAVARGKGWAWLLAVIKGRREDAQRLTALGVPVEPLKTYRQRADEAILAQWAPNMVKKP